jgi:hypothetical protein
MADRVGFEQFSILQYMTPLDNNRDPRPESWLRSWFISSHPVPLFLLYNYCINLSSFLVVGGQKHAEYLR